jgi:cytochrome b561
MFGNGNTGKSRIPEMAQQAMKPVTRYHPVIALLHWVLAVLIIGALILGYFRIAPMANADPQKIGLLRLHMAGGIAILVLMMVRYIFRLLTAKPPAAVSGHPTLDRLAVLAHYAFYVLILLMTATGLITSIVSGLNLIVFGGSGDPLPPSLMIYPTRVAHGYLAAALAALIGLHVVAALYHQLFLRDGLFQRVWFRRRETKPREFGR